MTSTRRMTYQMDVTLEYTPVAVLRLFDAGAYTGRPGRDFGLIPSSVIHGALPLSGTDGPLRGGVSLDAAVVGPVRRWGPL